MAEDVRPMGIETEALLTCCAEIVESVVMAVTPMQPYCLCFRRALCNCIIC